MDNITHSLTGLAMAKAGLDRFSPHATALLILSANAPDLDAAALIGGPLSYLKFHRGYTHSLIGLPFVALLTVLTVALIFRQKLPWGKAWLLCVIGVASHLLLDWTPDYGIRLLLPFSSKWFALDLNSLFDAVIMAVLVIASLWPYLENLVNREIGDRRPAGRGAAVLALLFFAFYDGGRALMHSRAVAQLESVLYDGAPPLQTAALPNPYNPFHWEGIVETAVSYRSMPVSVFGELEPQQAQVFYKPPIGPALEAAKQTQSFRYFLYFARFPVWSKNTVTNQNNLEVQVSLSDLRYGARGSQFFRCLAVEDERAKVLKSEITY